MTTIVGRGCNTILARNPRLNNMASEAMLKLMVVGASDTGKAQLINRFCGGDTTPFIQTVGIDFKTKHVKIDDEAVKLQVWDTAGQERFKTVTYAYLRGAHGVMLVFNPRDRASFDSVREWAPAIKDRAPGVAVVLLALHHEGVDAEGRDVSAVEASALATALGIPYHEASLRGDVGPGGATIEGAFDDLARRALAGKRAAPADGEGAGAASGGATASAGAAAPAAPATSSGSGCVIV